MPRYHVTYFYLATGMEGHADTQDHGIVIAANAEAAKRQIAGFGKDGDWVMGCLTAKLVGGYDPMPFRPVQLAPIPPPKPDVITAARAVLGAPELMPETQEQWAAFREYAQVLARCFAKL